MDTASAPPTEISEPERGNNALETPAPSSLYISSEADLIAFTRLPLDERVFTQQLRGVLAESALTGRIRYKWPLLRPLVDFVLEQVLTAYDAETRVEVGPPGPDSVSETIERFQKLLSAFSDAPWTFQRLCEILLEPKRQYSRLSKLVLAIEKCLLVTTEQPPTDPDQLPPPPLCSSLGPVNVNPPPVYTNTHHGSHGGHGAGPSGVGADDSSAFTNSLIDVRHHPHHHHHLGNHVGTPEHIEEDHWPEGLPEGKGSFKAAGVVGVGVGVGLHGALRGSSGGGAGVGHGSAGGAGAGHGSPGSSGASGAGSGSPGGGGGSGGGDAHGAHHYTGGTAPAVGPHTLLEALNSQHHGGGGGSPGVAGGSRRSSGGGGVTVIIGSPGGGGGSGAATATASDSATASAPAAASGVNEDAMAVDSDPPGAQAATPQGAVAAAVGPATGKPEQHVRASQGNGGPNPADCSSGKEPASCSVLAPPAEVQAVVGQDGDVEMQPVQDGDGGPQGDGGQVNAVIGASQGPGEPQPSAMADGEAAATVAGPEADAASGKANAHLAGAVAAPAEAAAVGTGAEAATGAQPPGG